MSDLQELYNIDEQLDSALDDDDLEAYGSLVKQREKIVAALDSDSDAVATIEAEKAKAAEGSPAHQLSTTKTNIEIAERNLAAATDGMERAALTAEIQHLTEEAEIMDADCRRPIWMVPAPRESSSRLNPRSSPPEPSSKPSGRPRACRPPGSYSSRRSPKPTPRPAICSSMSRSGRKQARREREGKFYATDRALRQRTKALEEWERERQTRPRLGTTRRPSMP